MHLPFLTSHNFLEDHALKIAKTLIEGVQILHVTTMQQIQLNAHAEPQALWLNTVGLIQLSFVSWCPKIHLPSWMNRTITMMRSVEIALTRDSKTTCNQAPGHLVFELPGGLVL